MHEKIPVFLVDNYDSFTYNLVQLLEQYGAQVKIAHGNLTDNRDYIYYNKIIFSPGAGLPDDFPLMNLILSNANASCHILGICLGHQCIATHFGAHLYRQSKLTHGLQQEVIMNPRVDSPILTGIPLPIKVGLYHSWAVEEHSVRAPLQITCLSERNVVMGVKHTGRNIEGLQFHPESILTPHGALIIKNWLMQENS